MYLAEDRIQAAADDLRNSFRTNTPFPHVVIDDLLDAPPPDLSAAFPEPGWDGWHRYKDVHQQNKMVCSDIDGIPEPLQAIIQQLNGPKFLRFLENVSGIEGLLPDPYLEGGGLHCSGPGGVLATHTDFHVSQLGLYRRLNLLLYLNEEWHQSWGGCLEMYEPGRDAPGSAPEKTVVPGWGTCVIFQTDHRSPHGFTKPITEGHWRRSIALYYYTAGEAPVYSGDHNTYWRLAEERGVKRRVYKRIYGGSMRLASCFSQLAHRFNPQSQPLPRRHR